MGARGRTLRTQLAASSSASPAARPQRALARTKSLRTLLFLSASGLVLGAGRAMAEPKVPSGQVNIQSILGLNSSTVTVTQSAPSAIVNWYSFNLKSQDTVNFNQASSSWVILNRVTGNGHSSIDGTINAVGKVFIVNPDGIIFGQNAKINTGSFLATTSKISDWDFLHGRYKFSPDRDGHNASIVNQGHITASTGGFAALVAPGVRNSGTITATLGTVILGAGNYFNLDFYGDKLITLGVNDSIAGQVKDVATGQPLKSLITNTGKLSANGGRVELTAAAA